MRDQLLHYYERELAFIRKMASSFAEKYPEVAGRLQLEPTKCEDPHVERLIEAFSMLAARIQMRLNDDFSEASDALLGILYPHYLSPIPSMTIVQMSLDPESAPGDGVKVERHSILHSRPVEGVRCRFRTAYPLTLWPIEVEAVDVVTATALGAELSVPARAALRIRLHTQNSAPFSELSFDRLQFFLDAESGQVHRLFELLTRDPLGLAVQKGPGTPAVCLSPQRIRPMGFARDEGLLEYPEESFLGYRHLQEYFAFSDKFLFIEISGLDELAIDRDGEHLDLSVLLSESVGEIDLKVEPANLKLGCTPAVNLFRHMADPIRLTQRSIEYPVVPDARSRFSYEVYSVRDVTTTSQGTSEVHRYQPFYNLRHGTPEAESGIFWHAARRASIRKDDPGTEVFLTLVDEKFNPLVPPSEVVNIETLCTNRDLPARLPFGDPRGDFQLEGRPGISRICCLRNPTPPMRAPVGEGSRWRIVSHLALNHLSLSNGAAAGASGSSGEMDLRALDAFREILRLYDFADSPITRQRISGLVGIHSRKIVRRVGGGDLSAFARGLAVELTLDPDQFTGTGLLLFASVLEAFLGLYASVNSFTQTTARIWKREGVLKQWPPRAGEIQIL